MIQEQTQQLPIRGVPRHRATHLVGGAARGGRHPALHGLVCSHHRPGRRPHPRTGRTNRRHAARSPSDRQTVRNVKWPMWSLLPPHTTTGLGRTETVQFRAYMVSNSLEMSRRERGHKHPIITTRTESSRMSLEAFAHIATVVTLMILVYVQAKPAINRWATIRYLRCYYEFLDDIYITPKGIPILVLVGVSASYQTRGTPL